VVPKKIYEFSANQEALLALAAMLNFQMKCKLNKMLKSTQVRKA
jgi:hypothetical protein